MDIKQRLRRIGFSICWDIGDTFMGWALKCDEVEEHFTLRVQPPKPRTINLRWVDGAGLVEMPHYGNSANGVNL